ncbi:MAG: tyrosine-type recombinase/integrase [Collinsella intestinalis]
MFDAPDLSCPVGLRDAAMLELFLATGARISELSRLELGDVCVAERQVRLLGKGSKERIVPLYARAVEVYERYLENGRSNLLRAPALGGDACRAVFVSDRGRAMNSDALRYRFDVLKEEAGISSDITPHAMRHTFATELLGGERIFVACRSSLGMQVSLRPDLHAFDAVDLNLPSRGRILVDRVCGPGNGGRTCYHASGCEYATFHHTRTATPPRCSG